MNWYTIKTRKVLFIGLMLIMQVILCGGAWAQKEAIPIVDMQAAILMRLLPFNKNISAAEVIKIQVIGNSELAEILKAYVGTKIGNAIIGDVIKDGDVTSQKADLIVIDQETNLINILDYARANNLMTITNNPSLTDKGVTLSIGFKSTGNPELKINAKVSQETKQVWDSSMLKIATMF